jgi:hypothetical protein
MNINKMKKNKNTSIHILIDKWYKQRGKIDILAFIYMTTHNPGLVITLQ